ncbi:MAG: hypothetical protein WDZ63_03380 [Burkholderiales bacterium]
MLHSGNALVDQILIPFVLWVFIVTGLAGLALGVGLIVRGAATFRALGSLNRWVSVRNGMKPLEEPHDIGKAVYGHRRWFGIAFAIGGAFTVFMMLAQVETASAVAALAGKARPAIVDWALESLKWLLVIGGTLAVIVGVMLAVSPDALRALETRTNRWYSPRQLGKNADTMHFTLDRWVEAHPRTAGSLLTTGAAIVLIGALYVWSTR